MYSVCVLLIISSNEHFLLPHQQLLSNLLHNTYSFAAPLASVDTKHLTAAIDYEADTHTPNQNRLDRK